MKKHLLKAVFFILSFALFFIFDITYEPQDVETQEEIIINRSEIPQLQSNQKEQIIQHEGFTISYNSNYRIANWVAYELTEEKARSNKVERYNLFLPDPKVKGTMASDKDYRKSGYDRGHLVPAGDMKWSKEAMEASFYFSNICPQNRELNSGLWHDLEKRCRRWAIKYGQLMIITGPVIEEDLKRIGANKVAVPRQFYKVIYNISEKHAEGIGFIFENKNCTQTKLYTLAIPIDSVEKVTGIDFYPSLTTDVKNKTESIIHLKHWGL